MEFTVKRSVLQDIGLAVEEPTVDSFHCGYCDFFYAASSRDLAIEKIKKHVREHD